MTNDEKGILKKHLESVVHAIETRDFKEFGKKELFVRFCCPICQFSLDIPFHYEVYKDEDGNMHFLYKALSRPLSRKFGKKAEKLFEIFWKHNYPDLKLEKEEKTKEDQFLSAPDYCAPTLKIHFEVKMKPSYGYFDTLRTFPKKIWLGRKSIDLKNAHQRKNRNELYVIAIYFADNGWFIAKVSEIAKKCETFYPHKSNEDVYLIPLRYFERFDEFINPYLIERNNLK